MIMMCGVRCKAVYVGAAHPTKALSFQTAAGKKNNISLIINYLKLVHTVSTCINVLSTTVHCTVWHLYVQAITQHSLFLVRILLSSLKSSPCSVVTSRAITRKIHFGLETFYFSSTDNTMWNQERCTVFSNCESLWDTDSTDTCNGEYYHVSLSQERLSSVKCPLRPLNSCRGGPVSCRFLFHYSFCTVRVNEPQLVCI